VALDVLGQPERAPGMALQVRPREAHAGAEQPAGQPEPVLAEPA